MTNLPSGKPIQSARQHLTQIQGLAELLTYTAFHGGHIVPPGLCYSLQAINTLASYANDLLRPLEIKE